MGAESLFIFENLLFREHLLCWYTIYLLALLLHKDLFFKCFLKLDSYLHQTLLLKLYTAVGCVCVAPKNSGSCITFPFMHVSIGVHRSWLLGLCISLYAFARPRKRIPRRSWITVLVFVLLTDLVWKWSEGCNSGWMNYQLYASALHTQFARSTTSWLNRCCYLMLSFHNNSTCSWHTAVFVCLEILTFFWRDFSIWHSIKKQLSYSKLELFHLHETQMFCRTKNRPCKLSKWLSKCA